MKVPLEVSPEVAVMSPEIVGVAVHAIPVTVRFPPRVVRPVPTVKVLVPVTLVAPLSEIAPVPVPKVPVPEIVVLPVSVSPPVPWMRPVPALTPTAVTAPAVETWNCEVAPTEKSAAGEVVPMPTLPPLVILIRSLLAPV